MGPPRECARYADDGRHLTRGKVAALDLHLAAANIASELLLENTFGSQEKWLSDVGAHTLD